MLGTPIPNQYRSTEPGVVGKVTGWALDPMTWRDLAWLVVACTVGFAVSLIAVLLLILIVTGAFWYYGIEPIMKARSYMDRWMLSYGHTEVLEQRVQRLTETRADAVDHSAAELRRIERDLHDGAQARLVAHVDEPRHGREPDGHRPGDGAADDRGGAVHQQGGARRAAVGGARHPPAGARRPRAGGAVEALALDMAIPVRIQIAMLRPAAGAGRVGGLLRGRRVPGQHRQALGRRPTPGSRSTTVAGVLRVDRRRRRSWAAPIPTSGTGMRGVMRRLSAFDGTMRVSSPSGGPTIVTLEVPCDLSSPRTTPSSGPA